MKINLGFFGVEWTPVHLGYWVRKPRLPRVKHFYSMAELGEFTGFTYVYNLQAWDKRLDRNDGWRWQRQDKHVPILGIWQEVFPVRKETTARRFQFLFWKFDVN
ncbi:MAG: hypothetical protein GY906_27855 [bacterium]|nr:hypothetical protein [bacterium]